MVVPSAKLYQTFLGRLKTQERAYNELGLFYTPRLYSKFVKRHPELKPQLTSIYETLLNGVGVVLSDDREIKLQELGAVTILNGVVYGTLQEGKQIMLKDFALVSAAMRHITLDHSQSFYALVETHLLNLPHLRALTRAISKGHSLSKEQMRREYARVVDEYTLDEVKGVLKDVQYLAEQTKLVLMPSHLNYAKGKR